MSIAHDAFWESVTTDHVAEAERSAHLAVRTAAVAAWKVATAATDAEDLDNRLAAIEPTVAAAAAEHGYEPEATTAKVLASFKTDWSDLNDQRLRWQDHRARQAALAAPQAPPLPRWGGTPPPRTTAPQRGGQTRTAGWGQKGPVTHLTYTGPYAGQPVCGNAKGPGDKGAHGAYAPDSFFDQGGSDFDGTPICNDCQRAWNGGDPKLDDPSLFDHQASRTAEKKLQPWGIKRHLLEDHGATEGSLTDDPYEWNDVHTFSHANEDVDHTHGSAGGMQPKTSTLKEVGGWTIDRYGRLSPKAEAPRGRTASDGNRKTVPGLGCPHCKWAGYTEAERTSHIRSDHPGEYGGPSEDMTFAKDRVKEGRTAAGPPWEREMLSSNPDDVTIPEGDDFGQAPLDEVDLHAQPWDATVNQGGRPAKSTTGAQRTAADADDMESRVNEAVPPVSEDGMSDVGKGAPEVYGHNNGLAALQLAFQGGSGTFTHEPDGSPSYESAPHPSGWKAKVTTHPNGKISGMIGLLHVATPGPVHELVDAGKVDDQGDHVLVPGYGPDHLDTEVRNFAETHGEDYSKAIGNSTMLAYGKSPLHKHSKVVAWLRERLASEAGPEEECPICHEEVPKSKMADHMRKKHPHEVVRHEGAANPFMPEGNPFMPDQAPSPSGGGSGTSPMPSSAMPTPMGGGATDVPSDPALSEFGPEGATDVPKNMDPDPDPRLAAKIIAAAQLVRDENPDLDPREAVAIAREAVLSFPSVTASYGAVDWGSMTQQEIDALDSCPQCGKPTFDHRQNRCLHCDYYDADPALTTPRSTLNGTRPQSMR